MNRLLAPVLLLLLITVAGCANMNTIRFGNDKPEDLEQLLEQREFARVRQLTGEHPSLDSLQLQTRIANQEAAYEKQIHADVQALQSTNNLLGAVQLLSDALQRVPHSRSLRELRVRLEQERVELLNINERERLFAQAQYILDQKNLYAQESNLELPGFEERQKYKHNLKEAVSLSLDLVEHGRYALQQDKVEIAESYLKLSLSLNETAEATVLMSEIQDITSSRKVIAQKSATRKRENNRKSKKQHQENKTQLLVEEARQALAENDLQLAQAALVKIPAATSNNEVVVIQDNLEKAVKLEIDQLLARGDTQYRSDNVVAALGTWTKALALAPENPEIRGRIERANKVLARLKELKRQQAQ